MYRAMRMQVLEFRHAVPEHRLVVKRDRLHGVSQGVEGDPLAVVDAVLRGVGVGVQPAVAVCHTLLQHEVFCVGSDVPITMCRQFVPPFDEGRGIVEADEAGERTLGCGGGLTEDHHAVLLHVLMGCLHIVGHVEAHVKACQALQ